LNIASWLHASALVQPDAPALLHGDEVRANYLQFGETASAIGDRLKNKYLVGSGDRVAVFMKNSTQYLEVLYATWWLGAIAVPINCKLHPKEAAWIIENAEAMVLFSDDGKLGQAVSLWEGCREIAVDSPSFTSMKASREGLTVPAPVDSGALAWLFYTSGTTGRPKGVMLSHENLVTMSISYALDVDEVSPEDAILYAAPISHGAGLYNFVHVRRGAKHVVPPSRGFDPKEILDLGERVGRLSFFAAPTMVNRLVDEARKSGRTGKGIKSIVYGGGPMYTADIELALEVMGAKFIQIYGQGEVPMTITSLRREVIADTTAPRWRERLASVGTAQACVEVRVVDDALNDLPPNTPGEIIVRSRAVMQGYWRNERATSETLIGGWLKTGDIGHLDHDGFLTLTDRSKDVIISGGTNIYPREVEEVLIRCPAVSEAAVIGQPNQEWGEEVVAFIVPMPGFPSDVSTLEAWCRSEMASFKKPKRYEFCEELPKNNNGKILKTELRRFRQEAARQGSYRAD
jgi:acyl-CoA synthetase (AMP-forming)/AMP-acid ligase II